MSDEDPLARGAGYGFTGREAYVAYLRANNLPVPASYASYVDYGDAEDSEGEGDAIARYNSRSNLSSAQEARGAVTNGTISIDDCRFDPIRAAVAAAEQDFLNALRNSEDAPGRQRPTPTQDQSVSVQWPPPQGGDLNTIIQSLREREGALRRELDYVYRSLSSLKLEHAECKRKIRTANNFRFPLVAVILGGVMLFGMLALNTLAGPALADPYLYRLTAIVATLFMIIGLVCLLDDWGCKRGRDELKRKMARDTDLDD